MNVSNETTSTIVIRPSSFRRRRGDDRSREGGEVAEAHHGVGEDPEHDRRRNADAERRHQ